MLAKLIKLNMQPKIKQQDLTKEFWIPEGCFITELSNSLDDPKMSIAMTRVLPGDTTRWHQLRGIIERYYILKGNGLMEVGDLPPQEVTAGDVVLIPPKCRQRISNIGSEDLTFLAICTPRFSQEAYEEIEK